MIWYQYLFLVLGVSLYSLSQLHLFNKLKWQGSVYIYSFFGRESWVMKYKHWKNGPGMAWDETKPAYLGSTTFLVWTTDFYHLAQMLMKWCFAFGLFGITWNAGLFWLGWTFTQWLTFKIASK